LEAKTEPQIGKINNIRRLHRLRRFR